MTDITVEKRTGLLSVPGMDSGETCTVGHCQSDSRWTITLHIKLAITGISVIRKVKVHLCESHKRELEEKLRLP